MTAAPTRDPESPNLPALHVLRRMRWPIVLVWAVAIAASTFVHYRAVGPSTVMGTRIQGVSASIAVLDRGGPPLLASDVPYRPGIGVRHLSPVGVTDDQGIYLYLPLLGHLTGEKDPSVLMGRFFTGCFTVLVFILPILFFELFGSLLVSVVIPLLVRWKFGWIADQDLYWILAWSMLLGIPGLLLGYRWWQSGSRLRATALLLALGVAASFASSIRANAGLAIVVGGLGIALFAGTDRWRRPRSWALARPSRSTLARAALAAGLVLAYLSISSFTFAAVRDYRNSVIHDSSFGSDSPTEHPLWHNAYIGLGYLPNRYGIAWNDAVSADVVERAHPGTAYLSPLYETTLRGAYFHLLRHDPGFVANDLWTKARVIVHDAVARFWSAPILLALAVGFGLRRREVIVAAGLAVPAVLIGAASPLLAIPLPSYALSWTGAWGALWLVAVSVVVAELALAFARRAWRTFTWTGRMKPAVAVAGVTLVVALLAAAPMPMPASATAVYQSEATPLAFPSSTLRLVRSWVFPGTLESGWSVGSAALLQPDTGAADARSLYVRTSTSPDELAVQGPLVRLPAGIYSVIATMTVLAGGADLRVDSDKDEELASARFWYGEGDFASQPPTVTFTLGAPTRIRISIANWTPFPNASAFVLTRLSLQRHLPPAAYYRPRATPLTDPASLGGGASTLKTWPFDGGTPEGWSPAVTIVQTPRQGALAVVTSTTPSGYQLLTDPPLTLPAGRYAFVLDGTVETGGIELGVLDPARDAWIDQSHFWEGQDWKTGGQMAVTFRLKAKHAVQLVLSNWAPEPASSVWLLRLAELDELH